MVLTVRSHGRSRPGGGGGGGNAIYVLYGEMAADQGILFGLRIRDMVSFSSLTLEQVAKFVRSLQARVPIHSTVWHPPIGFNLFVFCPGN